ncbi:MAG: hypothetical protein KAS72_09595 [Phycisphaerales bacterium]|nr:hypothetical protein [Phycisphaerales bacterium]
MVSVLLKEFGNPHCVPRITLASSDPVKYDDGVFSKADGFVQSPPQWNLTDLKAHASGQRHEYRHRRRARRLGTGRVCMALRRQWCCATDTGRAEEHRTHGDHDHKEAAM